MKNKYKYITELRVFRARHKLTQAQLGEAVGMIRQYISIIESDQPPKLLEALLIAQYFNVSIEEIFKFEEIRGVVDWTKKTNYETKTNKQKP